MPPPAELAFHGDPWALALRTLLWSLPAGLLLNLTFLGVPAWGLLVVFGLALGGFGALIGFALRRWDRFGWDDKSEALTRRGRRPIALTDIAGLRVIRQGATERISVDLHDGGQRVVGWMVGPAQAAAFVQSFRQRLSASVVSLRRPEWLGVAVLLLLAALVAAGGHLWIAGNYPLAATPCQSPPVRTLVPGVMRSASGIRFALPAAYAPIAAGSNGNAVGFVDAASETRVFAHPAHWSGARRSAIAPSPGQRRMLAAMGLGDWTAVLSWVNCNRIGLLPRLVKALLLTTNGFDGDTSVRLEHGGNPESLLRVRQDHRGVVAELALTRDGEGLAWFVVTGPESAAVLDVAAMVRESAERHGEVIGP